MTRRAATPARYANKDSRRRLAVGRWRVVNIATGLLLAAVWLGSHATALAQVTAPNKTTIERVRIGFEGRYKVGYWTPVAVTLRGGDEGFTGAIELFVRDGDGVETRVTTSEALPVQTTPGVVTSPVVMYAKFGRMDGDLRVRFVADEKVRAEREFQPSIEPDERNIPYPSPSTDELILTLGPSVGVAPAVLRPGGNQKAATHVVDLPDVSALPTRWYGYEGVDMLVLSTSQPDVYRQLAGSARIEALKTWVEMGGRLVMFVGAEAPEILDETSPLAPLTPGVFDEMVPLRQTRALEAYCDTTKQVDTGGRSFRIDVPRLVDITGNIEAHDGNRPTDLPLVIRSAHGFGEVVLVAVDIDRPPFLGWKGRPEFLRKVLRRRALPVEDENANQTGRLTAHGYTDLVGQLRHALEQFQGVTPAPFGLVAGLVFLYILLIGPGDYFFVKKFLKRMELTWITFPAIVVGVSVGAYYLAYWMKGDELRVNQVELVDVDLQSGRIRGTTWTQIFSPRPDAYNLSLDPRLPGGEAPQSPRVLLSWLGLPGTAMGGMGPRAADPPMFSRPYLFSSQLDELENVPIQVWSTKSVTARWTSSEQVSLTGDLTEEVDRMLSGQIANDLGVDLVDCRLFYDRWLYTFPSLKDGARQAFDRSLAPKTIKTGLAGRRYDQSPQNMSGAYSESSQAARRPVDPTSPGVPRPYNLSSQNVPYILSMMMFGEAVGGVQYTRLLNRYQSFCDLSAHLKVGRAILLARVANDDAQSQGSQMLRDGKPMVGPDDRRWVFYRFVIPVQREH